MKDDDDPKNAQSQDGGDEPGDDSPEEPRRPGILDFLFIPVCLGIGIVLLAGVRAGLIACAVALGIAYLFLRGMRDPS